MATATPELQPVEESRDKGLKSGALGLVSSVVMGVASTAPAYSLAATLLFVVVLVGVKAPSVAVLAFVPILFCSIGYSEMNKADPDCGTTFTWASQGVRPEDRLGGRLGHRRGRHPGHGQPGPGRGSVRVPAVPGTEQLHRDQPGQWLGAAGRRHLDHRDDLHLLPGHRGLGHVPEGTAEHRARHAPGALSDSVHQGRGQPPPEDLGDSERQLAAPHPPVALGLPRRDRPDAVHLLGLGHRRLGQRGNQGQEQDAGPGGDHLHRAAAGHLPDRDLRGGVVRRHRPDRDRAVQRGTRRRCPVGARRRDLRRSVPSAPRCPGC